MNKNVFVIAASLSLPQRPIGTGQFRNTATPTSMNPGFPTMGLQQPPQQHSPNSLLAVGPRIGGQSQPSQLGNLQLVQKRPITASFGYEHIYLSCFLLLCTN